MSKYVKVSDTITRPNDDNIYADTDLIASTTTAGDVTPLAFKIGTGGFDIKRITVLKTDAADLANAEFTLHFYDTSTALTSTVGDNGLWTKVATAVDGYMGEVDIPVMTAGSDDASTVLHVGDTGYANQFSGYSKNGIIYAWLVNDSTYRALALEVFTVELIVDIVKF